MIETKKIVVSRKWKQPEILVRMTDEEIGIEIDLHTFIDCMAQELGGAPFVIWTKDQLHNRLEKATSAIVQEMKNATNRA